MPSKFKSTVMITDFSHTKIKAPSGKLTRSFGKTVEPGFFICRGFSFERSE